MRMPLRCAASSMAANRSSYVARVATCSRLLGAGGDDALELGYRLGGAFDVNRVRLARGLAVPYPAQHIGWWTTDGHVRFFDRGTLVNRERAGAGAHSPGRTVGAHGVG